MSSQNDLAHRIIEILDTSYRGSQICQIGSFSAAFKDLDMALSSLGKHSGWLNRFDSVLLLLSSDPG